MPVILRAASLDAWLSEEELPAELMADALRPYPSNEMAMRPVSSRLNSARYDAPDVLQDDDPIQQGFGF